MTALEVCDKYAKMYPLTDTDRNVEEFRSWIFAFYFEELTMREARKMIREYLRWIEN